MFRRVALGGLIIVAVGCGSFNEPIPAPEPSPSPPADQAARSTVPAPPEATADPPAAGDGTGTSTPSKPACKVGFQKDILPRLAATCGQSTCHANEMNRPFIEAGSAKTTHDELMEFEFGSLEWSDPHSDYSGASEPDFKKAIDAWRLCGAPQD